MESALVAALPVECFSAGNPSFPLKSRSSVDFPSRQLGSRVLGSKRFAVSSALKMDAAGIALPRPDTFGRFGKFGGKYVPETLMHALSELEDAFQFLSKDAAFQVFLPLLPLRLSTYALKGLFITIILFYPRAHFIVPEKKESRRLI